MKQSSNNNHIAGQKFSVKKRMQSVRYALEGLEKFFTTEHNAWIHLAATVGVVCLSLALHVSKSEALLLVLTIGFVWGAELFNTSIEKLMDFVSVERKPEIKRIKDMSAAAVLIAAITALITGCFVFIPKI